MINLIPVSYTHLDVYKRQVQGYVKDPKKNIPNLIEYAKALRVQTRVKELIGVWL